MATDGYKKADQTLQNILWFLIDPVEFFYFQQLQVSFFIKKKREEEVRQFAREEELCFPKVEPHLLLNDTGRLKLCDGEGLKN